MFMLHGRLAAMDGRRDELLAVLEEIGQAAVMPGCRLYLVAVDETDPDGVWVTEVWESEEAHAASLQLETVKHQIARARPLLDPAGIKQQRLTARSGVPEVTIGTNPEG
jgi:quinol monooxygenase YgiN